MRVALHVGRCIGGIVGRQNPRYHLFGPQVDIVMKLEPCGTTAGVVVSSAFAALLSSGLGVSVSEEEAHRGQLKSKKEMQRKMGAAWYFSGGASIPEEYFEGFDAQRFCRAAEEALSRQKRDLASRNDALELEDSALASGVEQGGGVGSSAHGGGISVSTSIGVPDASYRIQPMPAALSDYPQPCQRGPESEDADGRRRKFRGMLNGDSSNRLWQSWNSAKSLIWKKSAGRTGRNVTMQPYTVEDAGKLAALHELLGPENQERALHVGWDNSSTQVLPLFVLSEEGACV
jgi:hypothetical protein